MAKKRSTKRAGTAVALHHPRPVSNPPSLMHVIASAAANPKVLPEKMRALLDMQKEIDAESARRSFTVAKIDMRRVMPRINKDGKIEIEPKPGSRSTKKQTTLFASFENIMVTIEDTLLDNGFDLWFQPDVGESNRLIIRGYLDHVSGHSKTCAIPMPLENSGSKNDAQGVGSSITYAKRYCTIALLNIISHAPQDKDIDGNAVLVTDVTTLVSDEQAAAIVAKCADAGLRGETLIKRLNEKKPKGSPEIESLLGIPASRYDETIERIGVFAAARAAREASEPKPTAGGAE